MALVRLARQSELAEGQKLVKESHGRKILLARTRGVVYATDAHCFHMGGNLWEGDIEDIGGHACVVCPLHRYKIDMATGQKVDTDLEGCVRCSDHQQQRTYPVYGDADFICINIPELHAQRPLPSDRYNQVAAAAAAAAPLSAFSQPQPAAAAGLAGGRASYGLMGSAGRGLAEPLAPYAGVHQWGLVPGTPSKEQQQDEPAMQLSQEASIQLSQEAPQPAPMPAQASFQQQQQQQAGAGHHVQGHIPFAQSRVDTARIARRKAATAAIAARAYMPPSAPALQPQQQQQQPPARGLFSSAPAAPQKQQQQQQQFAAPAGGLTRQASGAAAAAAAAAAAGPGGQQSLLSFGFTVQQRGAPPAVTTGPESMDMS